MKKELFLASIALLLFATPVIAQSNHTIKQDESNSKTQVNHEATTSTDNDSDDDKKKIKPTLNPCDTDDTWKNHGAYVSCIAHKHHLDRDEVRDAANSDIGKQNPTSTPTATISTSPTSDDFSTPTPQLSPSIIISPSPEATSTPIPDISDLETYHPDSSNFKKLIGNVVSFLIHIW